MPARKYPGGKNGFFSSMKLSIALFLFLATLFAVSTLIYGGEGEETALAGFYRPGWILGTEYYMVSIAPLLGRLPALLSLPLEFTFAIMTPFAVLALLLMINISVCTLKRALRRGIKPGSLLTHVSFVVIMLGAMGGTLTGVSGFAGLTESTSIESFTERATGRTVELPFLLYLDDFSIEHVTEPVKKLVLFRHSDSREAVVPVTRGGRVRLGGLTATVAGDFASTRIERDVRPLEEPGGVTALRIEVEKDGSRDDAWFFFPGSDTETLLDGGISVSAVAVSTLEEALEDPAGSRPSITLRDPETGEVSAIPLEPERRQRWPGTGYSAEILRYLPDFRVMEDGQRISASDEPVNPAVEIVIYKNGEKVETKWLFARFPDFGAVHGGGEPGADPAFAFVYPADSARSDKLNGGLSARLVLTDDRGVHAVMKNKGRLESIELAPGGEWASAGDEGLSLRLVDFVPSAEVTDRRVRDDTADGLPALRMALEWNGGASTDTVWLPPGRPRELEGLGLALFYSFEFPVKDYKSRLLVYEKSDEGTVPTGKASETETRGESGPPEINGYVFADSTTIEVNKPLVHEGFYVYQSSYDPDRPEWTGLQIKKNPWSPVVVTGFWMLTAGVAAIFYFEPLASRRRKRKKE